MDEQKFMRALDELRLRSMDEDSNKPEGRDSFAWGHLVGFNHGLRRAKALLMDMLREEKNADE